MAAQKILVVIVSASSKGSGKPAHICAVLPEPPPLAYTKYGSRRLRP